MNDLTQDPDHILQAAKRQIVSILKQPVQLYFRLARTYNSEAEIRAAVIRATRVTWDQMLSYDKHTEFVEARHFWCYFNFLYNEDYTCKKMAAMYDRHYTTVLHSIKTIHRLLETKDTRTVELEREIQILLCHEI